MWFSSLSITVLQVFMRPQSQLHKFPPNGGRSSFFWKPPGPDMGVQTQEEESDFAARSCPQFAASCLFLEPKPCLQRPSPAFGKCHQRGLRAAAAFPQILPRQGRAAPVSIPCWEGSARKGDGKTWWRGLPGGRARFKYYHPTGTDAMTQAKGLLLAERV